MPESPIIENPIVKYEVKVAGKTTDTLAPLLEIEVHHELFKVGYATLIYHLEPGLGDNKTFEPADKNFKIGDDIEIGLAHLDDGAETVFKGIIVRQQIKSRAARQHVLVVHCANKAVKMTLGRNSAFHKGKDQAIIGKVIGNHGLSKQLDATEYEHKSLVQYQAVDWDFIANRAEVNGLLLYTEEDKVCVKKPETSKSAALKLTFGKDVLDFDASVESRFQMPKIAAEAWSPKTQKLVKSDAKKPSVNAQGAASDKGTKLAGVLGISEYKLQSAANLEKAALKAWADAQLLRARLSRIRGTTSFIGSAKAKVNTLIELDGFGTHFNGSALITGVHHQVSEGFWKTSVDFGLSPQSYLEKRDVHAPETGGLVPAVQGLLTGKVKKIHEDEDGEFRVQVDIPMVEEGGKGIWARLSHLYATNKQGIFFFPEVDDEVILGFLNNDPRSAIILGSVYSSKNAPPYTPDDKNSKKAIVTKSKLTIEFDEEKKDITINTPKKNTIILSDEDGKITIQDSNKNKVELSDSGILLKTSKDIKLDATGKIDLNATGKISLKSKGGDVALEGLNVNAKAKMSFSANGTASAELKATGTTTVKGAMVMIN